MTPEELRRVTTAAEPFDRPLDYMPLPYVLVRQIRWLLTTSSSLPEERIATVDAIDRALALHVAHCDRTDLHLPKENH